MQKYLLISGILGLILITLLNLFLFSNCYKKDNNGLDFINKIFNMFNISWLILGCVIFWKFMNISECSETIYNYLMARFIIGIVSNGLGICIKLFS